MEKDRFGNLIFDNERGTDKSRIDLIYTAVGSPDGSRVGRKESLPHLKLKGMIEAGLITDASDFIAEDFLALARDSSTLEERVARCWRGAYANQVLIVREDETEGLCDRLRQPLDQPPFNSNASPDERIRDKVSEQAEKLANEIQSLQPGEATPFQA